MPSRGIRPKEPSARARRILRAREPKLVEDTKKALVIRGRTASATVIGVLRDLYLLKQPDAKLLMRKNDINPFEDATSVEFLMEKNDCSLFAFGSSNKKRPNNLILGRTFDGHLLDMIELGVMAFQSVQDTKQGVPKRIGSKPALIFLGDRWQNDEVYQKLQNLLVDFLRGDVISSISLAGIDHVLTFATDAEESGNGNGNKILMRGYSVGYKRSGTKTPNVSLALMGPSIDFSVRRNSFAAKDLWRTALRQPRQLTKKKVKNISRNERGDRVGRLHVGRQDLTSMKTRRVKALRETSGAKRKREHGTGDNEGAEEHEGQDNDNDDGDDDVEMGEET